MSLGYQTAQYAPPPAGEPANAGSGLQQAASGSVVGFDANVTLAVNFQAVGAAPVVGGYVPWDGNIP